MVSVKYAIHPGPVRSNSDGDWHYISAAKLAMLYKLNLLEYIVWDDSRPETFLGKRPDDYMHLWPREDGEYRLVAEE